MFISFSPEDQTIALDKKRKIVNLVDEEVIKSDKKHKISKPIDVDADSDSDLILLGQQMPSPIAKSTGNCANSENNGKWLSTGKK